MKKKTLNYGTNVKEFTAGVEACRAGLQHPLGERVLPLPEGEPGHPEVGVGGTVARVPPEQVGLGAVRLKRRQRMNSLLHAIVLSWIPVP